VLGSLISQLKTICKCCIGVCFMKKNALVLFLSFVVMLITVKSYAVGLGVHLTGGATFHRGYHEDEYGDRMFLGAGFIIDTTVAKNNLFNYRMHLDYTNLQRKNYLHEKQFYVGKENHNILNMQNSFGFGIVRLQNFRFWLGPHVHISYDFDDKHLGTNLGLALGFNYNMAKLITLSLDCGARVGLLEWNSSSGKKYTARIEPFVNLGILFRVKDEYSNEKILTSPEQQEKP